ncbi:MAG TPA: terminase family protein [Bryobacteraceae bacterium]
MPDHDLNDEPLNGRYANDEQLAALLQEEIVRRESQDREHRLIDSLYPDTGELSRDKYPQHLAFFRGGRTYKERLFGAGNRAGKTTAGAYELTLHLTGNYPRWWEGRRFDRPVRAWGAATTNQVARDVVQRRLFGSLVREIGESLGESYGLGTGTLPLAAIHSITPRAGLPGAIESAVIKHASGGYSQIFLKSYEMKREGFAGAEIEICWMDEEPESAIYTEALTRLMTTGGIMLLTATPLYGQTDLMRAFYEEGDRDDRRTPGNSRLLVVQTWAETPHLSEEEKQRTLKSYSPHELKARTEGVPALGAGAIFPLAQESYTFAQFQLPAHFARCYGLDVGWQFTACVWLAFDREQGICYVYREYQRERQTPDVHAADIQRAGEWIPGVIDPAAHASNQLDGRNLMSEYLRLGLKLQHADNSVEAGILRLHQQLSDGSLKIFATCQQLLADLRYYHRNERGQVVKKQDHLIDALRYAAMAGPLFAKVKPAAKKEVSLAAPARPWAWG